MTELEALAVRAEQASGPDRELDAEIAVALKFGARGLLADDHEYLSPLRKDDYREGCPKGGYWFHCRSGKSFRTASLYTASLDAAMGLVPAGWRTAIVSEMEHQPGWHWRLAHKMGVGRFADRPVDGVAPTPALALTAASLRAIAGTSQEQEG